MRGRAGAGCGALDRARDRDRGGASRRHRVMPRSPAPHSSPGSSEMIGGVGIRSTLLWRRDISRAMNARRIVHFAFGGGLLVLVVLIVGSIGGDETEEPRAMRLGE